MVASACALSFKSSQGRNATIVFNDANAKPTPANQEKVARAKMRSLYNWLGVLTDVYVPGAWADLGWLLSPVFLGAGIRFFLAGAGLLIVAVALRRSLRTDAVLATVRGELAKVAADGITAELESLHGLQPTIGADEVRRRLNILPKAAG